MNQRVLIVGDDEGVLESRALLLNPLGVAISSSSDAVAILFSQSFDVVVICQSVSVPNAEWIIAAARSLANPPALMAIRFPNEDLAVNVEVHETNSWQGPGWLKERVVELLAQKM